jgi:streptogramin lyase
MRRSTSFLCLLLACLLLLSFAGCGLGPTAAPAAKAGPPITGMVRGGQAPIVGSQVYLFAANTTGYGGPGMAASSNNASVSLLTSGTLDTSGGPTNGDYYVTTSGVTGACPTGGCFTITGDYACAAGQQVYLYAQGGSQGGIANPAAGLLAALGTCPGTAGTTNDTFPSELYVVMNEVSTIATAYAFAGFATDAVHVSSSGTALALTGISNAFANATNLATLGTGVALATTPAGNGTVPQAEINSLANILAACVNSNGVSTGPTNPTACYTLFNDAQSGGSSGTIPTDTATAAINMTHNTAANIAALYALSTATPPFAPALNAQPNDFTIGVVFTGGGLSGPFGVAIDSSGDVWATNYIEGNNVVELSSSGAFISGAGGYTGGGLNEPIGIAIDTSGDAWIANIGSGANNLTEIPTSGPIKSYIGGALQSPRWVAIDGSGNVWVDDFGTEGKVSEFSNSGSPVSASGYIACVGETIAVDGSGNAWLTNIDYNRVVELSSTGTVLSGTPSSTGGYSGGGMDEPAGIAVDAAGNVWVANLANNSVTKLSHSGSNASEYTGGGLDEPAPVAIDGSGNVWVGNLGNGNVTELSNSGVPISGANGYQGSPPGGIDGIAIDGSGDVWLTDLANKQVIELIGIATPVITPIAGGLPATPTADGSSKLGTRP